jgi:hypothetical protein
MSESKKRFRNNYGELFSEFESMEFGGIGYFIVLGRLHFDPIHQEAANQRAAADPEFKAMMDAFRKEVAKATEERVRIKKESTKLWKDLETKAALQTKLAKNLACISPFANFVYVARDLTGTGLRSLDYFEQVKGEYVDQFGLYAAKKAQDAQKNDPKFTRTSFFDLGDYPRFEFKEEALKDKLVEVLPYWGILVLFNVVFFVAAFAGFMIYDVR